MSLKEEKQAIRNFVRANWTDQKLAEVYAFNRDGKMHPQKACNCLLGVTLSENLHDNNDGFTCPGGHYSAAECLNHAWLAEKAYMNWMFFCEEPLGLCQRRLSAILRAEMKRRAKDEDTHSIPLDSLALCHTT